MQLNKIHAVLNAYVLTLNEGAKRLRQDLIDLGITTVEDADPIVFEWACARHGVAIVESKSPRNKGQKTFDRENPKWVSAKTTYVRVMDDLRGDADATPTSTKSEGEAEEYEIPAELLAAAKKLAELSKQYEQSRKWASRALAAAFAK